jgi:hypothetical protein
MPASQTDHASLVLIYLSPKIQRPKLVLYLRKMEINLIAKNKIADYIQQQPESQTTFLNWL